MPLFHPKKEKGYPANCVTVDDAVAAIRSIFESPGFRVERLSFECITKEGNVLKLKWDRNNVGQRSEIEAVRST